MRSWIGTLFEDASELEQILGKGLLKAYDGPRQSTIAKLVSRLEYIHYIHLYSSASI